LLKAASDQGLAAAQYLLAEHYEQDPAGAKDIGRINRLYRKAAAQQYAPAQRKMGLMSLNGTGMSVDAGMAVSWLTRAAQQDDADAQYYLGMLYRTGRGVGQDPVQAAHWLEKAAGQGHARAQYNLGLMYKEGTGVDQDYREAARWYRAAAERGEPRAQNNLGNLYVTGRGVPQDYVLAHKWFNLAGANGNENGIRNRDILAGQLSDAQLTEAQRLARAWHDSQAAWQATPANDAQYSADGDDTGIWDKDITRTDALSTRFSRWFGQDDAAAQDGGGH